eukprot:6188458-Pleurochrysis_carterae.AAC.3
MCLCWLVAQEHPDGEEPWLVVKWCEVLTLLGLTHYNVAIYDSEVRRRAKLTSALSARALVRTRACSRAN